jgi:hypothetical protein
MCDTGVRLHIQAGFINLSRGDNSTQKVGGTIVYLSRSPELKPPRGAAMMTYSSATIELFQKHLRQILPGGACLAAIAMAGMSCVNATGGSPADQCREQNPAFLLRTICLSNIAASASEAGFPDPDALAVACAAALLEDQKCDQKAGSGF